MTHEHSALVKSDYDKLPREAKRTNDTTFDRIYKYYHNNKTRVELTAEEHAIRERWEKTWLLMCRHRTRKQAVDLLVKLFNISQATAFDDVRHAMMLFSNPAEDLKPAKRAIAETMALNGADRCWKNGDMEGYYKFTKLYQEVNQLDNEKDNDVGDLLKKLKPHQVIIVSSEAELEAQANKLQEDLIKDIDHKVIE
jgi:hypothetical protein